MQLRLQLFDMRHFNAGQKIAQKSLALKRKLTFCNKYYSFEYGAAKHLFSA
jgi:hypothetical protein